mgnify:CR=1 FL=1
MSYSKGIDSAEWQLIGANDWIFGCKKRGLVRPILGQVYFATADALNHGGWKWKVLGKPGSGSHGVSVNLQLAVDNVERVLGID